MSLPHVILTVLSTRDATGYDITKEFSASIGYFWKASHQQVYRELNKMAQQGLVTCVLEPQEGKPDRKVYSITDTGRVALGEWFDQPTAHPTVRDEFSAKLMACSVQSATPYINQLHELIEESRKLVTHYQDIEAAYYANPAKMNKQQRLERLTLRRNLLARQAWISWAQEVIDEFENMA
ncbi:PadR family transcriptional regulator [Vibrio sp. V27_P1S3P104]|uniref:PadR family transcriptional regulator n=1 Tax=unclassified Vibrio TaxID=2614977 RepID=UPI001372B4AC|nr:MULTISPECIES: PadR family transcriptional regulator [unclassified Vibrio]NAW70722.1 PadR family transcriptional regulator [Vibrio sp. V28_P6S34P95]NAX05914.1 PadR family transcriptional regulator [Vibrio sp. V30_P3S12P165]NAX37735.1 PadR family transcriptional regulator [Vibrio sp. V27_P1S3P104]NNN45704.1 PadR family transcriptional regulator [Vibrio sp. 1-1(7)]NNN73533.1 PadR family transcriptional regulator [Vibrio sp. 12-2(3-a)]